MLRKLAFLAGVASLPLAATPAQAALAFYSITGYGSGSWNGIAFNNTYFAMSLLGETTTLNNSVFNPLVNATIGIGAVYGERAVFQTPLKFGTFTNGSANGVFFSRADGSGDIFDFYTPTAIDLANSFGQVTGTGVFALDQFTDVPTTNGLLSFTQSSSVMFSGNVRATPAVPEPTSWAMMLIGFGAIGGAARYRRRKTNFAFA